MYIINTFNFIWLLLFRIFFTLFLFHSIAFMYILLAALDSEFSSSLERHRIDILHVHFNFFILKGSYCHQTVTFYYILIQTIRTLDPAGSGILKPADLKRALVVSGITVSSDQFQFLLDMVCPIAIAYLSFLSSMAPQTCFCFYVLYSFQKHQMGASNIENTLELFHLLPSTRQRR